MKLKIISILMISTLISSCASVISEANLSYNQKRIQNVVFVINFHTKYNWAGKENIKFYEDFSAGINDSLLLDKGINSNSVILNMHKFDNINIKDEVNEHNADTVIEVIQGYTLIDEYRNEVKTTYAVKIIDVVDESYIWQGEITLQPQKNGRKLAETLLDIIEKNQLEDGLDLF
jgi:hypothetical protein